MTEVEHEQPNTTAPRVEASRSRWRSWFAPTGTPPAWGLVRYMVCGLVVGGSLGAALPEFRGALLAALTGAVVAASGSGGPTGISRRVALVSAGLALVLTFVAFATGSRPVWAALAMPKDLAAVRVAGTLFGVILLAVVSLVLPDRVLFSLGVVILFAGIGLSPAYVIVGGGLTSIGSILLAGAPTGDVFGWAGNRLLDTIIGCAIAVVAMYLLWPRDREDTEPVPVPAT